MKLHYIEGSRECSQEVATVMDGATLAVVLARQRNGATGFVLHDDEGKPAVTIAEWERALEAARLKK